MSIINTIATGNPERTFFFVSAADLQEFAQAIVKEVIDKQNELSSKELADRLLTSKEVRDTFGISPTTLWRWKGAGLITPIKVGGQNRFSPKDVERLLSGRV